MNYSDSARIKAVLTNSGHTYTDAIDDADVVIFDTCSVRQKSEDKVTGKIREIPANKKIRITGCMIQHNFRNKKIANETINKKIDWLMEKGNFMGNAITKNPTILWFTNEEIEELRKDHTQDSNNIVYVNHAYNPMFHKLTHKSKNIELFFRIDDTWFLPLMMEKLWYEVHPDTEVTNEYTGIIPKWANQSMDENAKTVHIPISKGCSQFCAFCIVPYARWLEKHLPIEQIITEAKHHIQNGAEEIVLLWQIVNKHPDFVEICKQILAIPWGLKRLRYTSPYPTYYSDELLALHENEPRMCPHIHMPLQSWSDTILKKMFRGYTAEQFKEFVDKIHGLKRKISITTDIIVGFCDETDEDFQASLDMVKYAKFDMIYIGKYSTRPGTFAYRKYIDNVDPVVKQQRRSQLNELLTQISRENNKSEVGSSRPIMINKIHEDRISGYTDNMKNVIINDTSTIAKIKNTTSIGTFLNVNITDSDAFKLYAQPTT